MLYPNVFKSLRSSLSPVPAAAEKAPVLFWLGFAPLTLVPIATEPVLVDELSRDQINWLNDYHAHVYEMLSPRLHEDEKVWLKEKCAPIGR